MKKIQNLTERSYFAAGSAVVLATDFMVGDLGEIIRNWENPLTLAQSKSYALQENRVLLKLLNCFIVIKSKP